MKKFVIKVLLILNMITIIGACQMAYAASTIPLPLKSWVKLHDGTGGAATPKGRVLSPAVWDSYNHVAVYYGGYQGDESAIDAGVNSSSLWAFDPLTNTWSKWWEDGGVIAPVDGGTGIPRRRHVYGNFIYAPDRKSIIMYGGVSHPGDKGAQRDTWEFNVVNKVWTQRFPASNPGSRYESAMAYNPAAKKVIIYGGLYENYMETWAYDPAAVTWIKKTTVNRPDALMFQPMTFDSKRNRIVQFGGNFEYGSAGFSTNDLWTYDINTDAWTKINIVGTKPPLRRRHGFAYDPVNDVFLLYGGYGNSNEPMTDTWIFDPKTNKWTQVVTQTTPTLNNLEWRMVYSPEYNMFIAFLISDQLVEAWGFRYAEGTGGLDTIPPAYPASLTVK